MVATCKAVVEEHIGVESGEEIVEAGRAGKKAAD